MHKECQLPDGKDDPSKGNQLMEIYALEIQMHSARANFRKLKVCSLSLSVSSFCFVCFTLSLTHSLSYIHTHTPRVQELYERALQIKGLCNPRVSGIIHECGGKMHMRYFLPLLSLLSSFTFNENDISEV